jgi:hypothetical protein
MVLSRRALVPPGTTLLPSRRLDERMRLRLLPRTSENAYSTHYGE